MAERTDFRPVGGGFDLILTYTKDRPEPSEERVPLVGWTWSEQRETWLPTYYDHGLYVADEFSGDDAAEGMAVRIVPAVPVTGR